jgi:hypothetical protein
MLLALALDRAGRLWAGTDNGVDVYDQNRWRHYGREDGLIWDDTDSSALYADPDGSMWIGTSNGLSRYSAPPYPIPEVSSPVVLTLIEGESDKYDPGDHPELPFSRRSLLIRYASLSYQSESRTRFRYRLAGYDNTWRETSERSVRFAGLPAGSYIFEVIAAGSNGLWSPSPARFSFGINPPWWQTWWFLTLAVVFTLVLCRTVWRVRVRILVAQKVNRSG